MLRTDLPDHRRASEEQLVAALSDADPLALAEAYHRTIPAAHATARRLLSGSAEVEAMLRDVYAELWASPPRGEALEGWIRARCFAIAADDLRERDAAPASPSLTMLLPELPRPEVRYLDAAERSLAELDDAQRRALLLAHDKGVPTGEQNDADAGKALVAALLVLGGPEPGGEAPDAGACGEVADIGDWILGLLPARRATEVAEHVGGHPECAGLIKALRRGRRRLEGLPPTPDMGQRVLVTVLAGRPSAPATSAPPAHGASTGAPLASTLDDTGDLTQPARSEPDDTSRSEASSPYAELATLDSDTDEAVDGAEDAHDDRTEADGDEEELPFRPPRRSGAARAVAWILGVLFLLAGVVAGVYLGLVIWS